MVFGSEMAHTALVSKLVKYTIASVVLGSVADGLGASMPVSFMIALIGPPLLLMIWLGMGKPGAG